MKIQNKRLVIIKFTALLIFMGLILFFGIKFSPFIVEKIKEPEIVREYLRSYGNLGFLIFILVQAIHVVVIVIPGDIFNLCGGYIYGVPMGFLLSLTGIMLGSITVFYISRIFGYDFINMIISKEKIDKLSNILNSSKGTTGMFIICLIPGIPKDLLMYVAGVTPVKAVRLFFIYALSRTPGILIWVSVGTNAFEKNYKDMFITICGAILFITLTLILKNRYKKKVELNNLIE
ncbi:MAG: TVP38/TMEM64 family protein [Aliarcobacter sp.]|nr:TVP38/TMEM64 family protein [Aliarcobacter sp.]